MRQLQRNIRQDYRNNGEGKLLRVHVVWGLPLALRLSEGLGPTCRA